MKVAICFSGLIRTGCLCSSNLLNYFSGVDVDFFIHTWDYENQAYPLLDCSSINTEIYDNIALYIPHKLQQSKIDKFLEIYNPKKYMIESYDSFENLYNLGISEGRLISPLWVSLYRSVNMMNSYQNENNFEYDYVVKIRPDLLIKPGNTLIKDIELLKKYEMNSLLISNLGGDDQLSESCVFTDDVLFIGRTNTMKIVSRHGCPENKTHEYFMKHLIENNVKPYNADTVKYTILRPHLVHLDVNKDFDIIREEEHLLYIPESLYNEIHNK